MRKALLATVCMAAMLTHGATIEEARRIVHEYVELQDRYWTLTGAERERRAQISEKLTALGFDAFPVYYEILDQNFDNPSRISFVMNAFVRDDGWNLASEGKREALDWARKIVEAHNTGKPSVDSSAYLSALIYLSRKGDSQDTELFRSVDARADAMEVLTARVAGTNVFRVKDDHFALRLEVIPSVANTGPQGVYVREIIMQAWEKFGGIGKDWRREMGWDLSKMPSELLTMVVSFDAAGNPVCNVDLAKYGLTMPVIEPKPTVMDSLGLKRTVTFPPLSKTPPQKETDIVKPQANTLQNATPISEQPQATPKSRNPLWLGILALAVISAVTAWRLIKRKR